MKHIKPRFRSIFPYFGAKSNLIDEYPEPVYDTIIEPFAGGASYSLRYYTRDVILNDLYPPTVAIWRFLLSPDALRIVRARVPHDVEAGTTLDQLVQPDDPPGLIWLMRSQFAVGSFGMAGNRNRISPFGASSWSSRETFGGGFRARLEYWIPRISHWQVSELDYAAIPNRAACWFVDPPYSNVAGATYAKSAKNIDYTKLGAWCLERSGQLLVAENAGATWLPFKTLTAKRRKWGDARCVSETGEVLYERVSDDVGLF